MLVYGRIARMLFYVFSEVAYCLGKQRDRIEKLLQSCSDRVQHLKNLNQSQSNNLGIKIVGSRGSSRVRVLVHQNVVVHHSSLLESES